MRMACAASVAGERQLRGAAGPQPGADDPALADAELARRRPPQVGPLLVGHVAGPHEAGDQAGAGDVVEEEVERRGRLALAREHRVDRGAEVGATLGAHEPLDPGTLRRHLDGLTCRSGSTTACISASSATTASPSRVVTRSRAASDEVERSADPSGHAMSIDVVRRTEPGRRTGVPLCESSSGSGNGRIGSPGLGHRSAYRAQLLFRLPDGRGTVPRS